MSPRGRGPLARQVRLLALMTRLQAPLAQGVRQMGGFGDLGDRLERGGTLTELIGPETDAPLAQALLQAAEASEHPEVLLQRLGEFLELADRLRGRVALCLLYPRLVLLALVLEMVLFVAVIFPLVGPALAAGYPGLAGSGWVAGACLLLAAAPGLALGLRGWRPGALPGRADQSLWCRALAHLLDCGQPLPAALERAATVLNRSPWAASARALAEQVSAGSSLSQALANGGFDPLVGWAVEAGEVRQQPALALMDAARALEQEVELGTELQLRLLQPLALLALGLPVLLVLLSFWLPFYSTLPALAG